jgi:hypothetical protein
LIAADFPKIALAAPPSPFLELDDDDECLDARANGNRRTNPFGFGA